MRVNREEGRPMQTVVADAKGGGAKAGRASEGMDAILALRGRLDGSLLLPGDAGYDQARRLWNGMIDRRPAAIALCTSAADVAKLVALAAASAMPPAVRSGGHSIAGASCCDGGLMIDLSPMKRIEVEPDRRTARAQAGVLIGELDTATQAHGLAVTMGLVTHTGIAGLTLGGGVGRLCRSQGLACDNLLSAEVVLADGSTVRASASQNADLFWALRGGGGNFGIVTEFEYRLHPLGPTVLGGMLLWDWAVAPAAMRHYAAFVAKAPDEVDALGVLLTGPDGRPAFAVAAFCAGPIDAAGRALQPLREGGPRLAGDTIAPVAYTTLQASADPLFPHGRRYYWKTHFLRALPDTAIDTLLEQFAHVPSAMSVLALQLTGGAVGRVAADATAYINRDAAMDCLPIAIWQDPAQDARNLAWSRGVWDAMRPFATGGVYVNNLGEEGEERIRAAYGGNYARLAAVKAKYDPNNLFRLNQNIRPSA
jgi:FAD/FMN-containing dehydrogenase